MKSAHNLRNHPNLYPNQKRQGERRRELIQLVAFAGASVSSIIALMIFTILARPSLSIENIWPLAILVVPPGILLFGIMRVLMNPITSWENFIDQAQDELIANQLTEKSVRIFTKSLQTFALLLVTGYSAFFFIWAITFGGILRVSVTAGLGSASIVTLVVVIIVALVFSFGGPLIRIVRGFFNEGGLAKYVATHPRQFT